MPSAKDLSVMLPFVAGAMFFSSLSAELLKNCTVSVVPAVLQFANMLC